MAVSFQSAKWKIRRKDTKTQLDVQMHACVRHLCQWPRVPVRDCPTVGVRTSMPILAPWAHVLPLYDTIAQHRTTETTKGVFANAFLLELRDLSGVRFIAFHPHDDFK